MDCSPPGSSAHGILQARILEWVAISSSRDLPDPGKSTIPQYKIKSYFLKKCEIQDTRLLEINKVAEY